MANKWLPLQLALHYFSSHLARNRAHPFLQKHTANFQCKKTTTTESLKVPDRYQNCTISLFILFFLCCCLSSNSFNFRNTIHYIITLQEATTIQILKKKRQKPRNPSWRSQSIQQTIASTVTKTRGKTYVRRARYLVVQRLIQQLIFSFKSCSLLKKLRLQFIMLALQVE